MSFTDRSQEDQIAELMTKIMQAKLMSPADRKFKKAKPGKKKLVKWPKTLEHAEVGTLDLSEEAKHTSNTGAKHSCSIHPMSTNQCGYPSYGYPNPTISLLHEDLTRAIHLVTCHDVMMPFLGVNRYELLADSAPIVYYKDPCMDGKVA
jgi:hypothetical protein